MHKDYVTAEERLTFKQVGLGFMAVQIVILVVITICTLTFILT